MDSDPAIVGLGIKPGDMIKITRKVTTAGESFYYRYVVEVWTDSAKQALDL